MRRWIVGETACERSRPPAFAYKTNGGRRETFMAIKPPLMDLPIKTADSGFYRGFSVDVAVVSKIIISTLVVWAIFWPVQSGRILSELNSVILENAAAWYIWVVALFVITCLEIHIGKCGQSIIQKCLQAVRRTQGRNGPRCTIGKQPGCIRLRRQREIAICLLL